MMLSQTGIVSMLTVNAHSFKWAVCVRVHILLIKSNNLQGHDLKGKTIAASML